MLIKGQNILCDNSEQYVYMCVRSPNCQQGGWGLPNTCVVTGEVCKHTA